MWLFKIIFVSYMNHKVDYYLLKPFLVILKILLDIVIAYNVIKNMFWHYKHFWPINKCNFIKINVMSLESWSWLLVVTPCWHRHAISSSLKIESSLITIGLKGTWYYLIHKFNSFKYININSKKNPPKIEQVVILFIIIKPWCHVTSWCLLQLHNYFCDYVVINIVEEYNSCFWN
jgi:hypothetical protein